MNQEKNRSPNWGGTRENAGRKSIWNHNETCKIRIPKVFAPKLHEIAQKWDKDSLLEFDTNSKSPQDEYVANSSKQPVENGTESSQLKIDSVTKTSQDLSQAIDLAKQILRHKKSARISLAKFLAKLYNFSVKIEDLQ
ncbi:MAG: hypothetical protein QNJ37_07115 [Crocosphaera sp.]|nr:hypothetical protein [Crocosphaera sp.]